jgi:hypothetical protein
MNPRILRRLVPYLIVLLILAAGCFVVGNALAERSLVQAQAPAAPELAPAASVTCTIVDISAFNNRMHVRCQANTGGVGATVIFFAAPIGTPADSRLANRYMALLIAAQAFGKHPVISFADASQNPPGCLVADCRLLNGVSVP